MCTADVHCVIMRDVHIEQRIDDSDVCCLKCTAARKYTVVYALETQPFTSKQLLFRVSFLSEACFYCFSLITAFTACWLLHLRACRSFSCEHIWRLQCRVDKCTGLDVTAVFSLTFVEKMWNFVFTPTLNPSRQIELRLKNESKRRVWFWSVNVKLNMSWEWFLSLQTTIKKKKFFLIFCFFQQKSGRQGGGEQPRMPLRLRWRLLAGARPDETRRLRLPAEVHPARI